MRNLKLFLILISMPFAAACPDAPGRDNGADAGVNNTVTCMLDAECLNGQVCHEGACVDEDSGSKTTDAGTGPGIADVLAVEFSSPSDRSS